MTFRKWLHTSVCLGVLAITAHAAPLRAEVIIINGCEYGKFWNPLAESCETLFGMFGWMGGGGSGGDDPDGPTGPPLPGGGGNGHNDGDEGDDDDEDQPSAEEMARTQCRLTANAALQDSVYNQYKFCKEMAPYSAIHTAKWDCWKKGTTLSECWDLFMSAAQFEFDWCTSERRERYKRLTREERACLRKVDKKYGKK